MNAGLGEYAFMPLRAWLFCIAWLLGTNLHRAQAQENQWQSLAGEASAMSRKFSPEKMDYNLDLGPVPLVS